MLVRDVVFEVLRRQGITTIFGNPGSNELPFLAGMDEGFRYVLGLHEGAVLGMADGYAQVTGQPVLVNLHAASGTGMDVGSRHRFGPRRAGGAGTVAGTARPDPDHPAATDAIGAARLARRAAAPDSSRGRSERADRASTTLPPRARRRMPASPTLLSSQWGSATLLDPHGGGAGRSPGCRNSDGHHVVAAARRRR